MKEEEDEVMVPESIQERADVETAAAKNKKKKSSFEQSVEAFCSMATEEQSQARLFEMKCWSKDEDVIEREMFGDTQHIANDPLKCPEELQLKKNVDFDKQPLNIVVFRDFFLNATCHAKLMDDFHANTRSPHCATVANDKIKFHQEGDDDPDWVIKQFCLSLIAAATDAETGVKNSWKRGESGGRHQHANFRQHIPEHVFKVIFIAVPLMFASNDLWCHEKRDHDWDAFSPIVDDMNDHR